MKAKDKKELLTKSIKELNNLVSEAKDAMVELKLNLTQHKLKDTSSIFYKRREIAQMMTVIRMKELAAIKVEEKK